MQKGVAGSSGGQGRLLWRAVRHLVHLTVCATIFFQFPRMADAARGTKGEGVCQPGTVMKGGGGWLGSGKSGMGSRLLPSEPI